MARESRARCTCHFSKLIRYLSKAHCCYNRRMMDDDKVEKDEDRGTASEKDEKPKGTDDDAGGDEGELTAVKPKGGEPTGNLRRRAEWFRKRH